MTHGGEKVADQERCCGEDSPRPSHRNSRLHVSGTFTLIQNSKILKLRVYVVVTHKAPTHRPWGSKTVEITLHSVQTSSLGGCEADGGLCHTHFQYMILVTKLFSSRYFTLRFFKSLTAWVTFSTEFKTKRILYLNYVYYYYYYY
jgi:hypothetical protein